VERVYVSGIGLLTPLGNSWDEVKSSLCSGRSGIGPITLFDPSDQKVRIAGEVRDFHASDYMDPRSARRMALTPCRRSSPAIASSVRTAG